MKSTGEERKRGWLIATAAGLGVALAAHSATAQYASDFESLSLGVMTGQDGYYLPPGTNSVDYMVEAYPPCRTACTFDPDPACDIFDFLAFQNLFVGGDPCACLMDPDPLCDIFDFLAFQNAFVGGPSLQIVPPNPTGGSQYVRGVGPGNPVFARAQRDIGWPVDAATMSFDVLVGTDGTPGVNNLGSFSIQPFPGSASFIHLFEWMSTSPLETKWSASIIGFSALGVQFPAPGPYPVPGPEWENLALNKWYRLSITVDFATNQIIQATITDIDAGTSTTTPIADTYLEGGLAGGSPHPTGFRFFAGGSTVDNYVAWDNCDIR